MSENSILARLRRRSAAPAGSEVILGIGDDCALFRPRRRDLDLVFTTDMLIEDVHFLRETHSAADIGWKTLARGLSDIAAMGAEPRFCLVSLAVARDLDERWIDGFYTGLLRLARRYKTVLAGGDLARAAKVSCDIVVCGAVPKGRALLRSGARPGDHIYVSGVLGGSALGLETRSGSALRRHLRPEPRLSLGRFLREKLGATAAMDLSDGLSIDLQRLCAASGVSAGIDGPLPVFPGATLDQALHGGEDYELLFTLPPRRRAPESFEGLPLTCIGRIRAGASGQVTFFGAPLAAGGWDHFR